MITWENHKLTKSGIRKPITLNTPNRVAQMLSPVGHQPVPEETPQEAKPRGRELRMKARWKKPEVVVPVATHKQKRGRRSSQPQSKKIGPNFDVYNQDLVSAFGDRALFAGEESRLDDRDFVKKQAKKLTTISAAYGLEKAHNKSQKPS